jgi:hypothetical protein
MTMTLQLSPDHVTRLALVRYLLQHAGTLAENPSPLCSLALLSMHDAIEMMLDVLAEAAGASIATGRDFASYWSGLKNCETPVHLPIERQMKRLNQARVELKHHGQRPSRDQLLTHLDNSKDFVEDVCDRNFATSLSEISLVALIKDEKVRNLLKDAQEAIGRNDLEGAFTKAALGFKHGSADVGQFRDPALLGQTRLQHFSFGSDRNFNRSLQALLKKIDDILETTSNQFDLKITLVSLGIDFSSYNKFQKLTPWVDVSVSGIPGHAWFRTISGRPEDARWCIDFVTDFMLRVEGRRSEN